MTEVERIVSRARRGRAVFVGIFALLCFGGIAWTIVVNFQQDTKITRVERSACAKAPGGAECQRIRRQTDRKRTVADTCIAFSKVGYRCPAPSLRVKASAVQGGDALQPATAGQQPTPAPAGDQVDEPTQHGQDSPAPDTHSPTTETPAESQPAAPAPQSEPVATPPPATSTSPEPEPAPQPSPPPGPLDPVLTTVCSIVDRIAHLCS